MRIKYIQIRANDTEAKDFRKGAEADGQWSLSQWIRNLIMKRLIAQRNRDKKES